jgi:hypothetical protein
MVAELETTQPQIPLNVNLGNEVHLNLSLCLSLSPSSYTPSAVIRAKNFATEFPRRGL